MGMYGMNSNFLIGPFTKWRGADPRPQRKADSVCPSSSNARIGIKQIAVVLGMTALLQAQYQGVLTSVDHAPGNILATPIEGSGAGMIGTKQITVPAGATGSVNDSLIASTDSGPPFSRSYYFWAESTSSTLFVGGLSTVLLAASTVNGYEDIATITITGPKSGVEATRWDLPMNLSINYALSSGATPLGEFTTTATSYARAGSTASFTSTEATPQIALSYKTSADGAAEGGWSNAFSLPSGAESKATLIPSALESTVNQSYFSSSRFSTFHLALMQSSLRDVAAYSSFRIFPIPTVTPTFSANLGAPIRNEKIANTTYLAYSLETDSVALPTLTLSGTNGFPKTRWEILHLNPDGSSLTIHNYPPGTDPSNAVDLATTPLKLNELVKNAGTHLFRVYNRFDEAAIGESKELIYEFSLTVQFVVKVKANIHTYE